MGTQRTGDTESTTSGDKASARGAKRVDKEARQDTREKTARKGEDEPAAARGRAVINPPNPYPTGTCTNYHITLTTLCQARPPRASLHRKTPSAHAARALGVGERDVEGEQSVQHPMVSSALPRDGPWHVAKRLARESLRVPGC